MHFVLVSRDRPLKTKPHDTPVRLHSHRVQECQQFTCWTWQQKHEYVLHQGNSKAKQREKKTGQKQRSGLNIILSWTTLFSVMSLHMAKVYAYIWHKHTRFVFASGRVVCWLNSFQRQATGRCCRRRCTGPWTRCPSGSSVWRANRSKRRLTLSASSAAPWLLRSDFHPIQHAEELRAHLAVQGCQGTNIITKVCVALSGRRIVKAQLVFCCNFFVDVCSFSYETRSNQLWFGFVVQPLPVLIHQFGETANSNPFREQGAQCFRSRPQPSFHSASRIFRTRKWLTVCSQRYFRTTFPPAGTELCLVGVWSWTI